MAIHFLFKIKNDAQSWNPDTVYYYNGDTNNIKGVHNPEELKYIKQTYFETTGYDLVRYNWSNEAPVYVRLFSVLNPYPHGVDEQSLINELKELIAEYITMYADPDWFIARMVLPIRDAALKSGAIIGYTSVNQRFIVEDAILACDIQWAVIKYNNQTAYVPMGDISGDEYGIKERRGYRMPTAKEVVDWAMTLVTLAQTSDFSGYYTEQNMDFITWIFSNYFGETMFGETSEFLSAAELLGNKITYPTETNYPNYGDMVLYKLVNGTYRIGLVNVQQTSSTQPVSMIEQDMNPEGDESNLPLGGPMKVYLRPLFDETIGEVLGWVTPNYEAPEKVATSPSVTNPTPVTPPKNTVTNTSRKLKDEKGTYVIRVNAVNVRRSPTLKGKIVGLYRFNGRLNYDSVYVGDGYIWVSYIGYSGQRNYVAAGIAKGNTNRSPYGWFF